MNILEQIVADKKVQLVEEKKLKTIDDYIKMSENKEIRDFSKALESAKNIAIISEIKKASPSKGIIKEDFDPLEAARAYEKEDFQAYSILTERKYFLGKDEYVEMVKKITSRPILRKDFIVDEYQVYQSKAIGADAVLLIASVLKDELYNYYRLSRELGLHPLVEIHSEKEIKYIEKADPYLIGINNRDLETFKTDLKHTERIMKHLPEDKFIISESGIKDAEDLSYLKGIGVRGALIGESLMRNLENLRGIL